LIVWRRYRTYFTKFKISIDAFRSTRKSVFAVATSSVAMIYVNLPLVLLAPVLGPGIAVFALGDKLLKFSLVAINPLQKIMQGWVPAVSDKAELIVRCNRSLRFVSFTAALVSVLFFSGAPLVSEALTQGAIEVPFGLSLPLGIALGGITLTGVIGLVYLPALGGEKHLALSTLAGATAGIPLMIVALMNRSSAAMAWAVAVAEVVVMCYQLLAYWQLVKRSTE
jgi:hypothetical protein